MSSRVGSRSLCATPSRSAVVQRTSFGAARQQAIVADALESGRNGVQQKAADEFGGGQRHRAFLLAVVGAVVFVAEPDLLLIFAEQAVVGDRHAVRVAAEIVEHLSRPAERRLGVDDPFHRAQCVEQWLELASFAELFQLAVER